MNYEPPQKTGWILFSRFRYSLPEDHVRIIPDKRPDDGHQFIASIGLFGFFVISVLL